MLLPIPAAITAPAATYGQLLSRQFATLPADALPPPTIETKGPRIELPTSFKPHQPQIDEDTAVVQAITDGRDI